MTTLPVQARPQAMTIHPHNDHPARSGDLDQSRRPRLFVSPASVPRQISALSEGDGGLVPPTP
jgi:hypothetical protein